MRRGAHTIHGPLGIQNVPSLFPQEYRSTANIPYARIQNVPSLYPQEYSWILEYKKSTAQGDEKLCKKIGPRKNLFPGFTERALSLSVRAVVAFHLDS